MGVLFSCNSKPQRHLGGVQDIPLHSGNLGQRETILGLQPVTRQAFNNNPPPLRQQSTNVSPSHQSINFSPPSYSRNTSTIPESRSTINEFNVSDMSPSWTPNSDLIIGIDFGTTFTGVAYAHAAGMGPVTSEADMQRASEKVSVVRTWPSRVNTSKRLPPSLRTTKRRPSGEGLSA